MAFHWAPPGLVGDKQRTLRLLMALTSSGETSHHLVFALLACSDEHPLGR